MGIGAKAMRRGYPKAPADGPSSSSLAPHSARLAAMRHARIQRQLRMLPDELHRAPGHASAAGSHRRAPRPSGAPDSPPARGRASSYRCPEGAASCTRSPEATARETSSRTGRPSKATERCRPSNIADLLRWARQIRARAGVPELTGEGVAQGIGRGEGGDRGLLHHRAVAEDGRRDRPR